MAGVSGLSLGGSTTAGNVTDADSGELNTAGINCIRNFPVYGVVVWGARTLQGADVLASDWKYIPVRRLGFYIEESIDRGTRWMVFEPNAPSLWGQVILVVSNFMHTLFTQGAFKGATPAEAYFVRCDSSTMTQLDIANGILIIEIGFAPVKPAEFVTVRVMQQTSTQDS
jgi:phage tail sheath protein FI